MDTLAANVRTDTVVHAAAGKHDLRVVAELLGLMGQIVRVDADAVAAHQARREAEEIPLGAGGGEHIAGIEAEAAVDQRQFVHQRDVDVALGVFDDLGGFRDLDRRRAVNAGGNHRAIGLGDDVERPGVRTGDDLHDGLEAMEMVAGIDPFRRETEREIDACLEARGLFKDRPALVLGAARIDGGFVNDDIALLQRLADGARGGVNGAQVRYKRIVDRRRHRHDEEVRLLQILHVCGDVKIERAQLFGGDFARPVLALAQFSHARSVDFEADNGKSGARKRDGGRQTNVAQADNSDAAACVHD